MKKKISRRQKACKELSVPVRFEKKTYIGSHSGCLFEPATAGLCAVSSAHRKKGRGISGPKTRDYSQIHNCSRALSDLPG